MTNDKIEKIIHKHVIFNHYGVLMSDDIDIECLVDNLHQLFIAENERLGKIVKEISRSLCGKDIFSGDLVQYVKNEFETAKSAVELKERVEEVLDLVSQNPYCKEIFPEPTKEQYALFHSILQKHGLTLDRFSGAVSRKAWDGFKALVEDKLRQAIKEV